ALQVDGRARHQLTGLVPVVEAEREADEVRVKAVAQVHLDRERLATGDHPAAVHQDRAEQAQRHDRADVDPELLLVVRRERVVDDVLRHPDERDLAALVTDREHRRDDERKRVRPQEPEQAKKRAPVGNRGHPENLAPALLSSRPLPGDTSGMEAPEVRYAKSGAVNIAYSVVGEGPRDVVLVPGFISHLELDWEEPRYERFLR